MNNFLRFLVAIAGIALLAAGAAFALAPERVAADFAVASTGTAGLGTLRGDLGGLFLAMGAFALAGTRRGRAQWLTVPLAFVALILVLRIGHVMIDGVSAGAVRSLLAEALLVALFATSRRKLGTAAA